MRLLSTVAAVFCWKSKKNLRTLLFANGGGGSLPVVRESDTKRSMGGQPLCKRLWCIITCGRSCFERKKKKFLYIYTDLGEAKETVGRTFAAN